MNVYYKVYLKPCNGVVLQPLGVDKRIKHAPFDPNENMLYLQGERWDAPALGMVPIENVLYVERVEEQE